MILSVKTELLDCTLQYEHSSVTRILSPLTEMFAEEEIEKYYTIDPVCISYPVIRGSINPWNSRSFPCEQRHPAGL